MAQPYRRRAVSTVSRAYSLDPLERIEAIGGVNSDRTRWKFTQAAAIAAIEARTDEFFIDAGGTPVKLIVLNHQGQKYLKSEREKTHPDDLLDLVLRCPAAAEPERKRSRPRPHQPSSPAAR